MICHSLSILPAVLVDAHEMPLHFFTAAEMHSAEYLQVELDSEPIILRPSDVF